MKKTAKKTLPKKTLPKKSLPPAGPKKPAPVVKPTELSKGKPPPSAAKDTSGSDAPLGHVQLWPSVVAPANYTTTERRVAALWTTIGNALGPPSVEVRLVGGASFSQMTRVTHVPNGRTVIEVDIAIFGPDGKALLGEDTTLPGVAHLVFHLAGGNAHIAARYGAALVELALRDPMALREHLRA